MIGVACAPDDERADNGAAEPVQSIRWATSAVGSSGHRALVNLSALLNREVPEWDITVLPMPGAIMGLRRYTTGELDGFYGADISFNELAHDRNRFAGFRDRVEREPLQTFWAYTMEMGLAIQSRDAERITSWSDLEGRGVFTGPRPWDTRAHLENLLSAAGVEHAYVELDLGMAGSQLRTGAITAIGVYSTGERDIPPWLAEAERMANLAILNPSSEERQAIRDAGHELVRVSPAIFETNVEQDEIWFSPFFYGFHLGAEFSAEAVYRMLVTIEEHASDLARSDAVFSQLARDMPALQRRGIASAVDDVRIHPGLARYLRERDAWDEAWNDRVGPDAQ